MGKPSNLTVTKDRTAELKRVLSLLARDRVLVGIPAEKAARTPAPGEPPSPLTNATIGYLNERGMPELNIPARPHLVPGTQRVLPKVESLFREAIVAAMAGVVRGGVSGGVTAIRATETKVGFTVTSSIKNYIAEGLSPPLAASTLAERARRGVTRTNPLQDTGQYRNNIDFVIRPAKGGESK